MYLFTRETLYSCIPVYTCCSFEPIVRKRHLELIWITRRLTSLLFCQPRVEVTSCFVYKVMGLTFHDRINTQLIYRIEIAQVVARRITKPERTFFRFESHWLLFFIHFFWGGGGGVLVWFYYSLHVLFFFLLIYFLIIFLYFLSL